MRLAVVANDELMNELLVTGKKADCIIYHINNVHEIPSDADIIIDLLFDSDNYDAAILNSLFPKPIIVNSVNKTVEEIGLPIIRINGWPGFLSGEIIEASCSEQTDKNKIEDVFSLLNRRVEWVKDVHGFITPRILSMIINEAWMALEENVSTKEHIDMAMKLGTNYPFGPFEWGEKIGLKNVLTLLNILSKSESRYKPANMLSKEVLV